MFNGHLDTSYSGREPWLRSVPGFQPRAFEQDGRLYGLGISNMKGAVACYVEAVRTLQDAGVRLRGDVLIAAVCGEIEKTQQGAEQGAQYRGYAAGTRYLVSHGGVADMGLLGQPTQGKGRLGHFGPPWLALPGHRRLIHTARSGDRGGTRARRRDRLRARGGRGRPAGEGRDAVVQRRVGAHAVRRADGQLRHLDRADGRRAGREPRDRLPRQDSGGLRAGGDGGLWPRLSGPSSGTSRPAASKAAPSGTASPTSSPRAASTRSRSRRRP